jgi:hypothetical protein
MKNPAAFQDSFWCQFITIWVNGFGLVTQLAWHILVPRQPLGFYIWRE